MASEELKPCPFCNGTDIRIHRHPGEGVGLNHHGADVWSMCCYGCGAMFPSCYRPELFVEKWNRRAQDFDAMRQRAEKAATYQKGFRGRVPEDLLDKTFNRLKVVARDFSKTKRVHWYCECGCGRTISVAAVDLKSGHTKSCGCLNSEVRKSKALRHGFNRTPTYVCWSNMHARCTNPNRHDFKNYGGRGISVCERWKVFENFIADMGEKPASLSIDRIDNDGNYEPGNCRWATASEQRKNQRTAAEIGANMQS